MRNDVTQKELKSVLSYDPEAGVFTWIARVGNRVKIGDVAGYSDPGGYRQISIRGKLYLEHRLAWLYVHGEWPKQFIDHINGIKYDNRLANLREATGSENQQNQMRPSTNNKLGILGVSARDRKFQAEITINRKKKYLGLFTTPEQAHAAYLAAKATMHPFNTMAEAVPNE